MGVKKVAKAVVGWVLSPTRWLWNLAWGALKKRLDDPQLVLEDALGRMEDEVREARESVASSIIDEKKLARGLDETKAEAAAWAKKARSLVAAGNDTAAREALVRQRSAEDLAKLKTTELERLRERIVQLKVQVDKMGAKLAQAKMMKGRLAAQMAAHKAGDGPDPFAEFAKIEEKIADMEVRAEVERDLAPPTALPAAEERLLLPASDVDEELEKLRKEIGSK